MGPQHIDDLSKHLDKQSKLLKEAKRVMTQELQNLQVEEHMMMNKLNEVVSTHRSNQKKVEEGKETDRDLGSRSEKPWKVYTRQRRKDRKLVSTDVDA